MSCCHGRTRNSKAHIVLSPTMRNHFCTRALLGESELLLVASLHLKADLAGVGMPRVVDAECLCGGHTSSVSPGPFLHGDCPAPEMEQWASSPPLSLQIQPSDGKALDPRRPGSGQEQGHLRSGFSQGAAAGPGPQHAAGGPREPTGMLFGSSASEWPVGSGLFILGFGY